MKIKIRLDDTSMVRDDDWLQMDGWLAGLRDDGRPDSGFWATGPVVLWDRYTAVARAARAVAVHGDGTVAAWGGSRDPGRAAGGYLPVGLPEPGWHR